MRTKIIGYAIFFIILVGDVGCHKEGPVDSDHADRKNPFPSNIKDRYIVFFLTNTNVDQAANTYGGKNANKKYNFVEEIPHIFGSINKDDPYKYAYGLPGPLLLTQSVKQMKKQVNKAFDLAEQYEVPVYFQLDDTYHFKKNYGSGATPKYYDKPEWSEWIAFPKPGENWGGQSHGRLPRYWFNWGDWISIKGYPCFECKGLREFVAGQLQDGVLDPLMKRYNKLRSEGKEYLFAGMAVGWETNMPDYSNLDNENYPTDKEGNKMQPWEATKFGYHSLYEKGYEEYNQAAIDTIIHDYSEFIAKKIYDAGVPKEKIFTHIVGIRSKKDTDKYPPIWTAVNDYSIPGFTMSPVTAPYDLDALKVKIRRADSTQQYFANAEGYARGINGFFNKADNYFESMFRNGASLVTVFGWGRAATNSPFAVSHSPDNPFVIAASKWLNMDPANDE